ncbi:MAG TPA: tryptophan 2,3-dioxygenase family protein [Chitinophagales bacterium]|nr:tryptophan 2,3-dioxygenase family protein [Chitinophagales bacterium]
MEKEVYYSDYLQLDKILNAQQPESDKPGRTPAHDEMLFIIIHQTYELWFKQVLYEVGSVLDIMSQPSIQDNSPDLFHVNHRLKRVTTILQVLIDQVSILETMTALDFLDFRNMLRPASGFQSIQFKLLEAHLGLKMEQRHGRNYYVSQLKPEDASVIANAEHKSSLIELINGWLERMPFFDKKEFWDGWQQENGPSTFWEKYTRVYESSLGEQERFNLKRFEEVVTGSEKKPEWNLSPKARRAALFILLYRDYPLLQLPFQLINNLLEIDECLATWRYRHMNMVHRMIGTRTGTGGSTGKDYLKGALDKHYIFGEFAELTTFMIERNKLPALPAALKARLGFEI